jgi:hypothetical protein
LLSVTPPAGREFLAAMGLKAGICKPFPQLSFTVLKLRYKVAFTMCRGRPIRRLVAALLHFSRFNGFV